MSFEFNVITSAGAALIAQATSSNPIVIVSAMSSSNAAESVADLASKTTAFYNGKTGTIFSASATNNVARIIMNFNNNSVQTPQIIKSACILARLQNQTDSQAVIMAACSDDASQITIPVDSSPLVHIHIPINISINTNEQVATVGAEYAAVSDLERFVSWHKAGDSSEGEAQTILGDKTFSNHATFNGLATFNNTVNIENSHLNADVISANNIECELNYLALNDNTDDTILSAGFYDVDENCSARIGAFSNEGDPDTDDLWNNCIIIESGGKPDGVTQYSNNTIKLSSRGTQNQENCYIEVHNGDGEPTATVFTEFLDNGITHTQKIEVNPQNIEFSVKNTDVSATSCSLRITLSDNDLPDFVPVQDGEWRLGTGSNRWKWGFIQNVASQDITTETLYANSSISTRSIHATMINGESAFVCGVTYLSSAARFGYETGLVFLEKSGYTPASKSVDFRKICKNILSGEHNGLDDTDRPIGMIGLFIYNGTATATINAGDIVSGDDLRAVALKVINNSISFVQSGGVRLGGHYTILCNIPALESGESALVLAVRSSNT